MDEELAKKRHRRNVIINSILLAIVIILIAVILINEYVLSAMRVVGDSMNPTLEDKQIVMVHRTKNVKKGDIIVFEHGDKLIVKRLIATSGDNVRIDFEGNVYLNDELLNDEYILNGAHNSGDFPVQYDIGEGMYFVLGDNRCNSNDSQDYGPIKGDTIIGKIIK